MDTETPPIVTALGLAQIWHAYSERVKYDTTHVLPVTWDALSEGQRAHLLATAGLTMQHIGQPLVHDFLVNVLLGWLNQLAPGLINGKGQEGTPEPARSPLIVTGGGEPNA